MVTIRLARRGGKRRPFYQITVADKSAPRDGRLVERVGFYNPMARGQEPELRVNLARVDHWLSVGAQPTARVRQLVAKWRKQAATGAAETVDRPAEGDAPAGEAPAA